MNSSSIPYSSARTTSPPSWDKSLSWTTNSRSKPAQHRPRGSQLPGPENLAPPPRNPPKSPPAIGSPPWTVHHLMLLSKTPTNRLGNPGLSIPRSKLPVASCCGQQSTGGQESTRPPSPPHPLSMSHHPLSMCPFPLPLSPFHPQSLLSRFPSTHFSLPPQQHL